MKISDEIILRLLKNHACNKSKVAKALQVPRQSLIRRIKKSEVLVNYIDDYNKSILDTARDTVADAVATDARLAWDYIKRTDERYRTEAGARYVGNFAGCAFVWQSVDGAPAVAVADGADGGRKIGAAVADALTGGRVDGLALAATVADGSSDTVSGIAGGLVDGSGAPCCDNIRARASERENARDSMPAPGEGEAAPISVQVHPHTDFGKNFGVDEVDAELSLDV